MITENRLHVPTHSKYRKRILFNLDKQFEESKSAQAKWQTKSRIPSGVPSHRLAPVGMPSWAVNQWQNVTLAIVCTKNLISIFMQWSSNWKFDILCLLCNWNLDWHAEILYKKFHFSFSILAVGKLQDMSLVHQVVDTRKFNSQSEIMQWENYRTHDTYTTCPVPGI